MPFSHYYSLVHGFNEAVIVPDMKEFSQSSANPLSSSAVWDYNIM